MVICRRKRFMTGSVLKIKKQSVFIGILVGMCIIVGFSWGGIPNNHPYSFKKRLWF